MLNNPSPLALTFIVIGALMSFGREPLTRATGWLFQRLRREMPSPRLLGITRLYFVFTGLFFTLAGLLGLLGIVRF